MAIAFLACALAAAVFFAEAPPIIAQVRDRAPVTWPGSLPDRIAALAVLQSLNADLLSHDSATLTLDRWCSRHRLADDARIVAERVPEEKAPTEEQRRILAVSPTEAVRYRRVRLTCGGRVLSEADNWYVPGRLTTEMNRVLDTTDTAFGRAVKELNFSRHTLAADLLWKPLPDGWDMAAPAAQPVGPLAEREAMRLPDALLRHSAVLTLPDGRPFSLVIETYTDQVMAFRPPTRPADEGARR